MVKAPQILTLLLKRFIFDHNTMSYVKSDFCVDASSELHLKARKMLFHYMWIAFFIYIKVF